MTTTRTYKKHDPVKIARKANRLGSGFKGSQLGGYAVLRAGLSHDVIRVLKEPVKSGKRGRPAHRYSLTPKGRSLARNA